MISRLNLKRISLCFVALALTAVSSFAQTHVYMMTNAKAGNSVLDYIRNTDGTLALNATVSTGGKGSGAFMNAAGGVTLHPTAPILFVVNPGDNSVSSLLIGSGGLTLVSHISSGGMYPVSVGAHNKKVYALNQGSSTISGFNLNLTTGALSKLAGSTQPLSGAGVAAAQVSFTNNGAYLIVTEKATSYIDIFTVEANGLVGTPFLYTNPAAVTPYGFVFDKKARVYITDANASGLSSYAIPGGDMTPISSFVKDGGNAACWIALNPAGTFAYVIDNLGGTHTTGGISVFEINSNGQVADLAADVISLGPGAADVAITPDGANLYYVVPGELSGGATVVNAFTVNSNGSLTQITGLTSGLPTTAEGMASR